MTRKEIQSLELVERIKWRLATKEIATKRREEVLIYILLNCLRGVWKSEVPSRLTNESFDFSGKRKPKGLAAYEMGGCLGAGGFGQVFSATRKRDKLPVSKELSLTLGQLKKKINKNKNTYKTKQNKQTKSKNAITLKVDYSGEVRVLSEASLWMNFIYSF